MLRWTIGLGLCSLFACADGGDPIAGAEDGGPTTSDGAVAGGALPVDAGGGSDRGTLTVDASGREAGGGSGGGRDASIGIGSADAAPADAGVSVSADAAPPGWKLVWGDEFDGPANTVPDPARWAFETGGSGFGNNQQEFDTARPENAALDGTGQLVLTARKESYMGKSYTSARLKTQGKFERTYGRFEARMRIPFGQGIWPAFWMLGADIGSAGWPTCGEIDIMENIGREPARVHGTLHGPGYSGGSGIGASHDVMSGRFADEFHVFAVEWEEQVVRWYVDSKLYQTRTPRDLPSGAKWVYDHPFFLLLNLAVGGQWPGNPDGTTTFPQQLTVDYVRVYERTR